MLSRFRQVIIARGVWIESDSRLKVDRLLYFSIYPVSAFYYNDSGQTQTMAISGYRAGFFLGIF